MIKKTLLSISMFCLAIVAMAQEANPTVSFYNKEDKKVETLTLTSEAASENAPLDISCKANVNCPSNYGYKLEWRIYKESEGENNPIITRFEDDFDYTLSKDGTFCMKLYITFSDAAGNDDDKELGPIKITIAGSQLKCPDGFSPNGDGINDYYRITCQSLVKISGAIFNRWGKRIKTLSLESLEPPHDVEGAEGKNKYDIWDGRINGKYVPDGVYFINFDAYGSDGIHYKVKKAINVLKGFREDTEGGESHM